MTDNDSRLEEQTRRGKQAQDVLGHPLYQEAITILRAGLYERFSRTKASETAERDEIWRQQQAIDWLEKNLRSVMETGKLAQHTLLHQAKEKARRVLRRA